jgi:hypothetical protein
MTERRKNDRRGQNQDYLMSDDQVAQFAGVSVRTVHHLETDRAIAICKDGAASQDMAFSFFKSFPKPPFQRYGGG